MCECEDGTSRVINLDTVWRLVVSFTSRLLYPPPSRGESGQLATRPGGLQCWSERPAKHKTLCHSKYVNDWIIKGLECCDSWSRFPVNTQAPVKCRIVDLPATEAHYYVPRRYVVCTHVWTTTSFGHDTFLSSSFPPPIPFCLSYFSPAFICFLFRILRTLHVFLRLGPPQ